MNNTPSHLSTPSPQPSPTRGEGVESQNVASELPLPIKGVNLEADQIHDEAFQSHPHPLRERVGGEGGLRALRLGAGASLIALIFLCLAWESILAPLKPGGSLLMLKAAPLLIPLFGILEGKRYTYQWASMFILFYFTEGAVRAWSDTGVSAKLAMIEVVLSLIFFICAIFYAKLTRQPPQ